MSIKVIDDAQTVSMHRTLDALEQSRCVASSPVQTVGIVLPVKTDFGKPNSALPGTPDKVSVNEYNHH